MQGSTYVKLPDILSSQAIDLGIGFYVFLAMLAIFSTNAINIYAGINGLEVGQTVVIVGSLILNNIFQLYRLDHGWIIWESHLFSLYILLPFMLASIALYAYNKFPAQVFVGDTYCYLAGMTIAASGIVGQNSKTVILFLLPQIVNFVYSVPQLFKIVPCPRHRMPRFIETGELVGVSFSDWITENDLGMAGNLVVKILNNFGQVEWKNEKNFRIHNLTVLNLVLWKWGPMKEQRLTEILLSLQMFWSIFAFIIRYGLARVFYEVVY
jgi:UDP-N-acetylglucosamine--dolichyl-phosphate N-acetylglucosaminephosphotransferase